MEIWCGRGVGIEILVGLDASQVTGIDFDPHMVALAQQRLARYNGRTRAFVGDAEAIDAPNASFDAVVDYAILHHVPDWRRALSEVARVLRPGGMFYFEDLFKGLISPWPVRALFEHPQTTQFTGREFRAGLERAGLVVILWKQLGEFAVIGRAINESLV